MLGCGGHVDMVALPCLQLVPALNGRGSWLVFIPATGMQLWTHLPGSLLSPFCKAYHRHCLHPADPVAGRLHRLRGPSV